MTSVVHWMGGWASNLRCWENRLQDLFPAWEHRFIDTHRFLSKTPAEAGLNRLPEGHVVAAWSMGSLLAHQWMTRSSGWPENLPLLSLCPIFRFVGPEGIAEPILHRMKTKLESSRETVLRDFWKGLPDPEPDPWWEQAWTSGTAAYSTPELLEGLDFLRSVVVDPGALIAAPRQWELMVGLSDPLSKPGGWEARLPRQAAVRKYPGGHLPFQSVPALISESLNTLVPAHVH